MGINLKTRDDFRTCEHIPGAWHSEKPGAAAAGQLRTAVKGLMCCRSHTGSGPQPGGQLSYICLSHICSSNLLHCELTSSRHSQPGLSPKAFPLFCWVSSLLKYMLHVLEASQVSCGSLSFQAAWNAAGREDRHSPALWLVLIILHPSPSVQWAQETQPQVWKGTRSSSADKPWLLSQH